MSIVPNFKDLKREASVIVSQSVFAAKVVNNNDPLKLQRVQFRIKKIHRGVVDDNLPWALPDNRQVQGNNQVGSINIPVVGSSILVDYLSDYSVLYRGDFNQDTNKSEELTGTSYPNAYGFIDKSGNKFFVDTTNDTVAFTHLSGTQIQIAQDGKVTIIGAKGLDINSAQNIDMKATGNINISCASFNVNSNSISLKSAGALLLAGASAALNASGAVALNAASFALAAAFNLVPIAGWVTPPVATPTSPGAVITPPTGATPRTKPTITGFSGRTDY